VRNLTEFGAFVEITEGIDGLIHVSDMSWTKRVKHPSEVLKKGDVVKARITNIDVGNQRVSLSIKEFMPNEWEDFVATHHVGDTVDGKVVNVTDFGLFIDIYQGLEGLAHVSEIDLPPGGKLEDHYRIGDWVRARILRIEDDEKKVGLTMRGLLQPTSAEAEELEQQAAGQRGGGSSREAARESVILEAAAEADRPEASKPREGKGRKGEAKAKKQAAAEAAGGEPAAEAGAGDEPAASGETGAEPAEG
jgi:small subunit ribosomal protein S1